MQNTKPSAKPIRKTFDLKAGGLPLHGMRAVKFALVFVGVTLAAGVLASMRVKDGGVACAIGLLVGLVSAFLFRLKMDLDGLKTSAPVLVITPDSVSFPGFLVGRTGTVKVSSYNIRVSVTSTRMGEAQHFHFTTADGTKLSWSAWAFDESLPDVVHGFTQMYRINWAPQIW